MSKFKTVLIALLSLVGLAALVFGASKWIDQNN